MKYFYRAAVRSASLLCAFLIIGCISPNTRFQKAWYDGVRPRVAVVRGPGRTMNDYTHEFLSQLDLADRYGGAKVVFLGDSNAEYAARRDLMGKFNHVAVNLGIGGTATGDWVAYFYSPDGKTVLRRITRPKTLVVISLGGNDILQQRNRYTESHYARLRMLLPNSLIILIPPVHAGLVAQLTGRPASVIRREMEATNRLAVRFWGARVIDTMRAFKGTGSQDAAPGVLSDAVHYSPLAYEYIIRAVNEYLRNEFLLLRRR